MKVVCHCGIVEIDADASPREVTECHCSICRRYAALWAYYSPGQVTIKNKETTKFYLWGDEEVDFHRCHRCGCVTHYKTTAKCDEDIIAINMRMADSEALAGMPVRKINGAAD